MTKKITEAIKKAVQKIKANYVLVLLSLIFLYSSLSIYMGMILGYLSGRIFAGKKEKEQGIIKSLIIHLKDWQIHIHHWFWAVGLLALAFVFNWYFPKLAYGFLGGVALHGFYSYGDWYKIITKIVK